MRRGAHGDGRRSDADPRERRLLIIDAFLPRPDQDAGSLRMMRMIELWLELGYRLTFMAETLEGTQPYREALERAGVDVLHWPRVKDVDDHLATSRERYDVVVLSRAEIAWAHIDVVKRYRPDAAIVFDTVDLHFLRTRRRVEQAKRQAGSRRLIRRHERRSDELERIEMELIRRADVTLVVSDSERKLLESRCPGVEVVRVSTIYDVVETVVPFEKRRGLLFIGSFHHPPNVDAAVFLVEEVFPVLAERCPGVELRIAGSNAPKKIHSLARPDVSVLGYVQDISPLFRESRLLVAPMRYGAGVKGKISHAMAFGLPVVTTPIAVDGMHLCHGHDVLVGSTPEELAEAVESLYTHPELWARLSRYGMVNVSTHFSPDVARDALRRTDHRLEKHFQQRTARMRPDASGPE